MTLDDELRDALRAEADETREVPAGWERLHERIGSTKRQPRRWLLPAIAAAVVLLAAVGAWQVIRDDDPTLRVGGETTTTVPATPAPAATSSPAPSTAPAPATTVPPSTTTPAAPSTTVVSGTPPTVIVAVTVDGRLVVLDAMTGAELRQLADLGDPRGGGAEGPGPNSVTQISVTPDHTMAYFDSCCEPAAGMIFAVPVDGSAPPEPLTNGLGPAVSPDGRYLAYTAINAVVVRDLQTGEERTFTDPAYDETPLFGDVTWSADGTRIYYPWQRANQDGFVSSLIELDVAAGTVPRQVTESTAIIEHPLAHPDGVRVLMLTRTVGPDGRPGGREGMAAVTPDGLPPGVTTVPDDAIVTAEVADWGYDSGIDNLLLVTEDGQLVGNDRPLGNGYAVAAW